MDKVLEERRRKNGTSAAQEMASTEASTPSLDDGLKAPAGCQAPQAWLPGTEPEKKPREPRDADEIENDFRMAKFKGKILKISEDWKNDRDFKIILSVPSYQRAGIAGLENFNGIENMEFRVLPEQPRLDDKTPEDFGCKVPPFGVAMIERLESKSCQGANGWEKLTADEILDRITEKMDELRMNTNLQDAVDAANYLFFLWHNLQVACAKK